MMPDMDGFEVCRRVKKNPATQHIPVVMVTALDQPSDRVAGLDAGADDFLTKPVSDLVLVARVRSLARHEDDDRRVAHARGHIEGDRSRAPEPRGCGRRRPPAATSSLSTTVRHLMTAWRRPLQASTPSMSRSIPARPCSRPRRAIMISPSCRSDWNTTTGCGFAAIFARSSARATCRCWRSPRPTTMQG